MAPLPVIDDASIKQQFDAPATQYDLQHATESLSATLRVVVMILAGLTVATAALYCLLRKRRRSGQLVIPATPLLVYESTVSIEFDDGEDEEGTVVDVDDFDRRCSFETILSDGTPRKLTFDIDTIMPFLGRRGGILDRRGKTTTLRCDTTAYYETDIVPTATKSPIDRKMCRPKVGFIENIASPLSPFWAKQASMISPFVRPVFGFNPKTITPPLGSPMWSTRIQSRRAPEALKRKDCWTP